MKHTREGSPETVGEGGGRQERRRHGSSLFLLLRSFLGRPAEPNTRRRMRCGRAPQEARNRSLLSCVRDIDLIWADSGSQLRMRERRPKWQGSCRTTTHEPQPDTVSIAIKCTATSYPTQFNAKLGSSRECQIRWGPRMLCVKNGVFMVNFLFFNIWEQQRVRCPTQPSYVRVHLGGEETNHWGPPSLYKE